MNAWIYAKYRVPSERNQSTFRQLSGVKVDFHQINHIFTSFLDELLRCKAALAFHSANIVSHATPIEILGFQNLPKCGNMNLIIPGSKGLYTLELAHMWVKDLETRQNMSIKPPLKTRNQLLLN